MFYLNTSVLDFWKTLVTKKYTNTKQDWRRERGLKERETQRVKRRLFDMTATLDAYETVYTVHHTTDENAGKIFGQLNMEKRTSMRLSPPMWSASRAEARKRLFLDAENTLIGPFQIHHELQMILPNVGQSFT